MLISLQLFSDSGLLICSNTNHAANPGCTASQRGDPISPLVLSPQLVWVAAAEQMVLAPTVLITAVV